MTWIEKYNEINNSFNKKLLYQLGTNMGFFSQYNNMVLMMYYCLKNKIKFVLCSHCSNITVDKGWQDYFLPFCEEDCLWGDATFNPRQMYFFTKRKVLGKVLYDLCFKARGYNYHTYELFGKMQSMDVAEHFSLPELGLEGSLAENCRKISHEIWRYNEGTQKRVEKNISLLNTQNAYLSLHIRRGDKNTEISDVPVSKYMKKANELADIDRVFVATDDYRIYDYLRSHYPDYEFHTCTRESKHGYYQDSFDKLPKHVRESETIALLTDIEIMSRSELCVGTLSSNIGMFMYWKMPEGKFIGADFDKWRIWT